MTPSLSDWKSLCLAPLEGRFVRLEPLRSGHAAELEPIFDPALFRLFPRPHPSAQDYVADALTLGVAWLIRQQGSGRAVGASCYLNLAPEHLRLEIGATWLGREHQGTQVNPEAKKLLLGHAFSRLGCRRVEFKTDALNLQSQGALTRLGAVREGVLRSHMRCADGRQRDSVYFSVIAAEWPTLEERLAGRIL